MEEGFTIGTSDLHVPLMIGNWSQLMFFSILFTPISLVVWALIKYGGGLKVMISLMLDLIRLNLHPLSLELLLNWFLNFQKMQFTFSTIITMSMCPFCYVCHIFTINLGKNDVLFVWVSGKILMDVDERGSLIVVILEGVIC